MDIVLFLTIFSSEFSIYINLVYFIPDSLTQFIRKTRTVSLLLARPAVPLFVAKKIPKSNRVRKMKMM